VAPLVEEVEYGITFLKIIGVSGTNEPSGFLLRSEEYINNLFHYLMKSPHPVLLRRFFFSQAVLDTLKKKLRFKGYLSIRKITGSFYVPVQSDWQTFYYRISSKRRYDHRRALKRAEAMGPLSVKYISPEFNELDEYLALAYRIEAAGWKGRNHTDILSRKKLRDFLTIYLREACRQNILKLVFLFIGDQPVSMLIGLENDRKFWVLKIGYDETFASCSPGMLLMYQVLEKTFQQGLETFEFLGSTEDWILVWNPSLHPYFSLVFFPWSLKVMIQFIRLFIRHRTNKSIN
jgi:hypothetical protein